MSVLPTDTLLRVRREVLLSPDENEHDLSRRLGVSRGTVNRVLLMQEPTERCGGCGARVVMPCVLCATRGGVK
jgi:hypothetical protein